MNKLLLNYDDMRDLFSLKESYKLLSLNLNNAGNKNDNEYLEIPQGYFQLLSNIASEIALKLNNSDIDDTTINSNLDILKNNDNFNTKDYIDALNSFVNRIEQLSDHKPSKNDNTLNKEFSINIYPRKSKIKLNIKIKKIETGWNVYNPTFKNWVASDKFCDGTLFSILKGYAINYPYDLSGYLKWLWEISTVHNLTEKEVSDEFDELSKWINICNDYSPNTKLGGYK